MHENEPVAWIVVERGWRVVTADGADAGRVDEVIGDSQKDIFNGITVSPGALKASRYVPSEHVGRILRGRVELALGADELAALEDSPPGAS